MAHNGRKNADELLALHLAAGRSVRQAARRVGLGERTVHRRLGDKAFQDKVREMRATWIGRGLGRLTRSMVAAAETLVQLLGEQSPPSTRLGAAKAIVEAGTRLWETVELEKRIVELETRQSTGDRHASA